MLSLRCNGALPSGDKGRRKSRFALCRRNKANGVKPSTIHASCTPQAAKVSVSTSDVALSSDHEPYQSLPGAIPSSDVTLFLQAISNKEQHSISYTLSRAQTVVVEYTHDGTSDMFQVPRPHVSPQESRQNFSLSGLTQFVREQIY